MHERWTIKTLGLLGHFKRDRKGSISLYFAFALLPILSMMGLALDYGRLINARSAAQTAMDNAVLTAVISPGADAASMFRGSMSQSGITLTSAPTFTTNANGGVTGAASGLLSTAIMNVLGFKAMKFSVRATAGISTSTATTRTPNKVCILVLDPNAAQALLVNGNFNVAAPTCEIDVASTGSPAAIFNSGDNINVQNVCVQGSTVIQNSVTVTNLATNCATASDPFKRNMPAVAVASCTVSNLNYSGSNSLSPGVYCGNFNFNGSGALNLQPGLYVFSGAHWNLNSGWTVSGTGVTFYFADNSSYIQINSGVTVNISAPTSGTYANILMYEPGGLSNSAFTINAASGQTMSGLIYLPSRNLTFNSGSTLSSESLTLVLNQLILNSNSPGTWRIAPAALSVSSASYATMTTTTKSGSPALTQ
ncbi:hypothetical protein CCR94_13520 [Rhodoblastus sphagnicola]|uniref:Putative Flp pilus-assembly TadG-like N-terminal domain-containing protein n=1 Tax=Rhodoblastus sphagnicola TaxID=333368 RepID=A0A2S6N677_9HYPH|nr:Tad domain-containing protein [Rhodoblastus sphagnicola]MBB4196363.1 Flp pilus assembly protein TadG [Rhodoblastus sphagnicola]PPQ30111.1 hypothetical protein CCR94_13520 [Rhodoblastus sphagnicola]